jgi:hypothetical protein
MVRSRRVGWLGHIAQMGIRGILLGKIEGKKSLGRKDVGG